LSIKCRRGSSRALWCHFANGSSARAVPGLRKR
jgi:hypothetical protein